MLRARGMRARGAGDTCGARLSRRVAAPRYGCRLRLMSPADIRHFTLRTRVHTIRYVYVTRCCYVERCAMRR